MFYYFLNWKFIYVIYNFHNSFVTLEDLIDNLKIT